MNSISNPLVTGGLTGIAVSLTPAVQWAITGFHGAPPDSTAGLLSMGLVYLGHTVLNMILNRQTKTPPAQS